MRVEKSWNDRWNDVIRDVIFPNVELLDLMCIPNDENTRSDIINFIDKYFVKDVASDELVTTEMVRVCYSQAQGRAIGKNVVQKMLNFDIYVQDNVLHTVGDDLLVSRDEAIAQKLQELLTDNRYVCNLRFSFVDSYSLYTKLVGYHRYRIVFSYKTSF